ncbi:MAG: ABC transporter ATP-binding protein [Clostridia bacterium]|nr:ABC transporter ATP-binding protein [Clostridia bacterium]
MIGEVIVDLIQPRLMAKIVDEGVLGKNLELIITTGLTMLALVAVGGLAGILSAAFASNAAQRFGNDLRNDVFRKVMSLSLQQTDKFTTGSLVTRLTNNITAVQDIVSQIIRMFVRATMQFVGGIYCALRISGSFGIILLIALPIQLFLIFLMLKKASPLYAQVQEKLDRVNSVVQENVTGARVVKAYVKEQHEIGRFNEANTNLRDINLTVQKLMATLSPILMIIMNASVIAILLIGGQEVQDSIGVIGGIQVGDVMSAITYVTQILMSMMMVSMMFQSLTRASASAKRIIEVLDSEPVIKDGENASPTGETGSVTFKNVSFRYPNSAGRPVLHDINLDIKKGETVAVIGATGSGKSSLVNLIPRFYDADEGEVLIDGRSVKDYNLDTLRHKIAFVLQKTELFSGTVAQNIRWGYPDATNEEVEQAAKIAQADDFIRSFADDYNTVIAEKGASLSGGQKQRIAIDRALIRRPEILIFDDSTSALDLGTEARLHKALRENIQDTTIIMIAQRIASIKSCDRIAVIENGTIIAFAPHDELMKTCETYRDIYSSQMKNGGNENG